MSDPDLLDQIRNDPTHLALQQLNHMLKRSDYFNSIMQTHRSATERIVLCLIREMVGDDLERMQMAMLALKKADVGTGHPSADTEVRRMTVGLRAGMQKSNS